MTTEEHSIVNWMATKESHSLLCCCRRRGGGWHVGGEGLTLMLAWFVWGLTSRGESCSQVPEMTGRTKKRENRLNRERERDRQTSNNSVRERGRARERER